MKRRNVLATLLAVAAMFLMIGFADASKAQAQCPGCPTPGVGYWVNYNYVYPPATATIPVTVNFARFNDVTSTTADGHYTYPQNPAWGPALTVTVLGTIVPIPSGGPVMIPTPNGILRVETKCNPCLEVDISY